MDREEPATYTYFRQAGAELGSDISQKLEGILAWSSLETVGSTLVNELGVTVSRAFAARVRYVAEERLKATPTDKVARNARRWSGRAERRITGDRWEDPFDDSPTAPWRSGRW